MIYKGSIVKGSGGGSGDAVWGSITGTLSNQTDLQTALNEKQDTLTAGSGIEITNNVISATGGGGSVSYDNATINENASNQLQAIGVVDKNDVNDQKLGFWCGTQQEWDTGATVVFYDWTRQCEGFNVTESPWFAGQAIINTGTYYIAAYFNHISISSAGTSWSTVHQYNDSNSTEALAYDGNNTVVMVGNNVGAVSTDGGENWIEDYNWGGKIDITCVTINNTPTFLAIDEQGGLYSSTDGTTITAVNTLDWDVIQPETAGSGNPHVVSIYSYNGTVRILTKQGKVAVSTDGLATWTAEQIGTYTTDYPNLWVKLSCFEATNTWVALKADGTTYYNNGNSWVFVESFVSMINPDNNVTYKSIAYDSSTNNEKMIALASDGSLKYTTDGTTGWTAMTKLTRPDPSNHTYWMAICSNGSGGFCAVNTYGIALWGTVTEHVYTRTVSPSYSTRTYPSPDLSSQHTEWGYYVQTYDSTNNQITLYNGNVYTYDAPVNGTGSIGEIYPNYICYLTDTQEIRKDSTTIANGQTVTVDQDYFPWSEDAQSGIAVAQAIASIPSGGLSNTATGMNALTILGIPTNADSATNIGVASGASGICGVAIGYLARTDTQDSVAIGSRALASNYTRTIAIGTDAVCTGENSIQIGQGTNSENNTLKVGFGESDGEGGVKSYTLLGITGLIPVDRLTVFKGANGTNAGTKGGVPAPTATDNDKFLKGDGTWSTASNVSGTFTTNDGKTITITNGIVTSIV